MSVKTYDPAKVINTFNGVLISGFMPGTFVKISRQSDSFALTIGSDGEPSRVASTDKSGEVTFTLLQTSASNDYLSGQLAKDELTRNGTGSYFCKDASGRTVAGGADAWVKKPADVTFSNEEEGREWTLTVANLDVFIGGN